MLNNCFCLHLMSCTGTDTSNIQNGKKINDNHEDIFDNDLLTYSTPAYDFVNSEVSSTETKQVSANKCQLMPLIFTADFSSNL